MKFKSSSAARVCSLVMVTTLMIGHSFAQNSLNEMIPSSAMAAVFLKPKNVLAQPGMELVPHEIITAFGKKELGFDPCEITNIMFLVDSFSDTDQPPEFGLLVEFDSPQQAPAELIQKMGMFDERSDGKTIYRGTSGLGEVLMQLNEKTFAFGVESFLKKMQSAKGAKSNLLDQINQSQPSGHFDAYVTIEPVRALIKQQLPPADRVPPPFANFLSLPDLIDSISINKSFAENGKSRFQINAINEQSREEIERILQQGLATAQQLILAQIQNEPAFEDPDLRQAVSAYVNRMGNVVKQQFRPMTDRNSLYMDLSSGQSAQLSNISTIGILTGMLLPAVQQVREAARRTAAANNLRQLSLAALNYESTYQKFPANANYSDDGKPLLSWRVHLLPFLDYGNLYNQFKLDEPWDSPHNIKFLDQMPEVYRSPNSMHTNRSTMLGISGKGTMFDGNKQASLGKIADGTSNTIFFVEVNDGAAVEWTKPGDYEMTNNPRSGLMGVRPGGFNAAFVDGSIQFIGNDVTDQTIMLLMQIADGQPTNF